MMVQMGELYEQIYLSCLNRAEYLCCYAGYRYLLAVAS